ncbi:hypothetical protein FB45DRAFT_1041789 [Roridomyces roridus]|uniref:Uncharacterized protein n=1 Tax=Roridomyces roridus TaxID=1738132 RepID=A0AAD7AZQ2_9AGAR|nr:hypothetical protein FB45DRAFT_1041789 [Roridomyces roridus]
MFLSLVVIFTMAASIFTAAATIYTGSQNDCIPCNFRDSYIPHTSIPFKQPFCSRTEHILVGELCCPSTIGHDREHQAVRLVLQDIVGGGFTELQIQTEANGARREREI